MKPTELHSIPGKANWQHTEPDQDRSPMPFVVHRHDLEQAETANSLIDEVIERHGRLDIVIAAHARSSHQSMSEVEATELDRCWAVNVRSIVLLTQRFAQVHEPAPPSAPPAGRMIWFTSGQHLATMDDEIAYAVTASFAPDCSPPLL